jgi:HlyD family secretion protein
MVNVDEADIGRVAEGQKVELTLDAFPDAEAEGAIAYISPLAQEEAGIISYQIRVAFLACEVPLREGLSVSASIVAELFEDRLNIPNSAIIIDEDTGFKYVARRIGAETEIVRIEIGQHNDMYSEVLSGLTEGDLVLARSSSYREQFAEMMKGSFPGAR